MKISRRQLRRLIIETVDAAAEWENIHSNPYVQQVGVNLEDVLAAALPKYKFQFFKNFEDLKGRGDGRTEGYHEFGSLSLEGVDNRDDTARKGVVSGVKAVLKQTARRNGLESDDLKIVQYIDMSMFPEVTAGRPPKLIIGIKVDSLPSAEEIEKAYGPGPYKYR